MQSGLETECPPARFVVVVFFPQQATNATLLLKNKNGENFTSIEESEKFTPLCFALWISS